MAIGGCEVSYCFLETKDFCGGTDPKNGLRNHKKTGTSLNYGNDTRTTDVLYRSYRQRISGNGYGETAKKICGGVQLLKKSGNYYTHHTTMKKQNTPAPQAEQQENIIPDMTDINEVRKAFIAGELLNRKY